MGPVLTGQGHREVAWKRRQLEDDDGEAGSSLVVVIVRVASNQPIRFYNDSQRILPAANELDVSAK